MKLLLEIGIAAAFVALTSAAYADDPADIVMLNNGGRLRGTVAEEDPQKGVTVKLVDGTVRKVSSKEIKEIIYANAAQSSTAAPAAPVQAAPQPTPIFYAAPPAYMPYARRPTQRQSGGLFAGGLVMTILGGIAIPAGVGIIATELPCHPGSQEAVCDVGAVPIVVGVVLVGAGISMMVVGGKRATHEAAWWVPTRVDVGSRAMKLGWSF